MKVTIRDVAKEAGVAPSTVSRVLSDNERISDETKEKVRAAIKKLHFKPNAIARSLANNKTQTIGVVLPHEIEDSFTNPFCIQAMQGISLYARQQHYYLMYAFAKDKKEELKYVKEFIQDGRVDGIIISKVEIEDEVIKYLKDKTFPFVVIGHPDDTENTLWVDNDNIGATYQVTNQLIKEGHYHIGFVDAKTDWAVSKDRYEGYRQALKDNEIEENKAFIYHGNTFDEKTGNEAAKALSEYPEITAIVTTDDIIAVGINQYLTKKQLERKVLIGFNNTFIRQYQEPSISSIDIKAVKLGCYACKLIINHLEGKNQKVTHYVVETEFIPGK